LLPTLEWAVAFLKMLHLHLTHACAITTYQ
jgi:hypothetical protein